MKLKERIIAILCAMIIIIMNFINVPMYVYAQEIYEPGTPTIVKVKEEAEAYLGYLACRIGALVIDHNFAKWVQAKEDYVSWWNGDNIKQDADGNYEFSEKLMNELKNKINEYVDVESAKFNDSLVQEHNSGNIHSFTVYHNQSYKSGGATIESKYKYTFSLKGRVAGFYDSNNGIKVMRFISERSGYTRELTDALYRNGVLQNQSDSKDHYDFTLNTYFELETQYGISCTLFSHTPVPIFATRTEAEDYIYHNKYGTAQNYNSTGKNIYITNKFKNYSPAAIKVDARTVNYYNQYYSEVVNNISEGITPEELEKILDDFWKKIEDLIKNPPKQEDEGKDPGTADLTGISKLLKEIKDLLEDIRTYVKKIRFWSALDTLTDIGDLVSDWIRYVLDLKKDALVIVGSVAQGLSSETDVLKTKFPFSLPWDMLFITNLLAATPQAPVFNIPFKIQSINFEYPIVIDLKNGIDTSLLSDSCRALLSVLYAYGLIQLTPKFLSLAKEE